MKEQRESRLNSIITWRKDMIEKIEMAVEVEKESKELGDFVGGLLKKTAECKYDDGEISTAEYAEIGMAAVMSAQNALEGLSKIGDAEGVEYVDVAFGLILPLKESLKEVLALKKAFDAK